MPELADSYKGLVMALSVPGLYCAFLLLGRSLKRKHGVRLGILYHLFSFCLALYIPAAIVKLDWTYLRHLGAASAVLGATFVIALIDRYVWDLYFGQRHKV